MSVDIRLPSITAKDPEGQIRQMQSYMYQLAEQLNWALNAVDTAQEGQKTPVVFTGSKAVSPKDAEETFNSIKSLIIKSADIVKAYEDTILSDFNGKYFAQSDFGTFVRDTKRSVEENSEGVTEAYENIQKITNEDGTGILDVTNAYIKRGLLEDKEKPIYGVEVGETGEDGGFRKYARFTADRLSFFDSNGDEAAYFGAGCLYVNGKTVCLGEIQLGGYKSDTSDGLAFIWIGG